MRALLAAIALLAVSAKPVPSADPAALAKSCSGGDPRACAELARRYRAGDGVSRDPARAVKAEVDGCGAGEPALCVEAGRATLRGEGVRPDASRARELFGAACSGKATAGCHDLALMLQNGAGVPQDAAGAVVFLEKGCAGEDGAACELLGDARHAGAGTPRDLAAAQAAFERGCALLHFSSCTKLADLLRVQRQPQRATELYRKACAGEERDACTVLELPVPCEGRDACLDAADLCADYLAGYDVLAEPSLARSPCEKACAGGVGEACDNLADMFQEGLGVPRSRSHATALRKRACELGDRDACDSRE